MEEVNCDESFRVVPVYHFTKDPSRTHGVPFKFVLKPVCPLPPLLQLGSVLMDR